MRWRLYGCLVCSVLIIAQIFRSQGYLFQGNQWASEYGWSTSPAYDTIKGSEPIAHKLSEGKNTGNTRPPSTPPPPATPPAPPTSEAPPPPPPAVPGESPSRTPVPQDCHKDKAKQPIVIRERCREDELIAEDRCEIDGPEMSATDHLAVVSRGMPKNVTWLADTLGTFMPYYIYAKDRRNEPEEPDPKVAARTIKMDWRYERANEHTCFLLYIVNYYDCLPRLSVFLHEHQQNLHMKYFKGWGNVTREPTDDVPAIMKKTCWNKITEFQSLTPFPLFFLKTDQIWNITNYEWSIWMKDFGGDLMPYKVNFYCCTNFIVHRDVIRRRPKEWWINLLRYTAEPHRPGVNNLAYILEWSWNYMFYVAGETMEEMEKWGYCYRKSQYCNPPLPLPWPTWATPLEEVFGC